MRTFLLSILIAVIAIGAPAQTKKSTSKRKAKTAQTVSKPVVKSDEEITLEKAQDWFREKYVEDNFKDPYSYRVVGIKAVPVTTGESVDKLIAKVKKNMDESSLHPDDCTEAALAEIKAEIAENERQMKLLKNKTDEYSRKKYNIYAEYNVKFLNLAERVEKYLLDKEEYESLLKSKAAMSEEVLNSFAYYDIHLDCYSKNDLGNEVLGRYVFPFTKDGPVVDDKMTLLLLEKVN